MGLRGRMLRRLEVARHQYPGAMILLWIQAPGEVSGGHSASAREKSIMPNVTGR